MKENTKSKGAVKPIKFDDLTAAQKRLEQVAGQDPEEVSQKEAIEKMFDQITTMKQAKHRWSAIVGTLQKSGVNIQLATLRTYYYAIKKERGGKNGKIVA